MVLEFDRENRTQVNHHILVIAARYYKFAQERPGYRCNFTFSADIFGVTVVREYVTQVTFTLYMMQTFYY